MVCVIQVTPSKLTCFEEQLHASHGHHISLSSVSGSEYDNVQGQSKRDITNVGQHICVSTTKQRHWLDNAPAVRALSSESKRSVELT